MRMMLVSPNTLRLNDVGLTIRLEIADHDSLDCTLAEFSIERHAMFVSYETNTIY